MTVQQESMTNTDSSIKSIKSDDTPSTNQKYLIDMSNNSESSNTSQGTVKKQELTPIGSMSNIGTSFMNNRTHQTTPEENNKSTTVIGQPEIPPNMTADFNIDIDIDFLKENTTNSLHNDSERNDIFDILDEWSNSGESYESNDQKNQIDTDDNPDFTNQQEDIKQAEVLIPQPHYSEDSQEFVSNNPDDFFTQLDEINQNVPSDNPFSDSNDVSSHGASHSTHVVPSHVKIRQLTKKKDKKSTTLDRLLSGVFSGFIFGFAGVLIDLCVSAVRAISGMGSGDILWLFTPFLAILGLILGFIRATDDANKTEVNTPDHSVYTESSGLLKLIITTVTICVIIWMIVIMMS